MALDQGINISSMKINLSDKIIAWLALLSGLTISAVAIWYSVAGLVSIFAATVIPIIVMGVALEISKLIATVWLKLNWSRAPIFIRSYLLGAIAILMVITSMGIFGFLSKAHSDQSLVSGDVQSKIAIYDEKIKTAKENIESNRKQLKQMDEAVDQVMARSQDEKGADKANAIRKSQSRDRAALAKDIEANQKLVIQLNDEAAPIRAEVRKVEAEVGPIKYIAAFIYGSNPDANILEKAVTWVIIIIVSVFDPLAVILLLASQYSFQWFRTAREEQEAEGDSPQESVVDIVSPELTVTEQEEPKTDAIWPFPSFREITHPEPVKEEIWEDVATAVVEEVEAEEDHEHIEQAPESEKAAMKSWKANNPGMTVKMQRKLLANGSIDKLPWEESLQPKEDFVDPAIAEAAKWAEEHPQTEEAKAATEWAEEKMSEGYMENVDGHQVKKTIEGYQQNAEQTESTLWQRVKATKGE
jgi:hypothetical protein